MAATKERLDILLVQRGLAPSRERAQALILSGNVLVRDQPITKSGHKVETDIDIRIRGQDHPYVSRGALKLLGAIDQFKISISDRVALDVGASTGGFTEILLLKGARRVHALDVGHNQLAWKIRTDPRVKVYEKTNARELAPGFLGESADILVMDVSFISVTKIFPALLSQLTRGSDWIVLIKPQFEVGRDGVGKGGIVRDEELRLDAVERVTQFASSIGLVRKGLMESPIEGTDGNKEYLAWFCQGATEAAVERAE
jgi:23S rRNA (cytidine1920-2'-O)/16S rRNA (cytidine1409-2'-O)-methyltransferase